MPMKPYKVICLQPECAEVAVFKIASLWSDGGAQDLKTYALCCKNCLANSFSLSLIKHKNCRTIPGEILEPPMIFDLTSGKQLPQLVRRTDLESLFLSPSVGSQ